MRIDAHAEGVHAVAIEVAEAGIGVDLPHGLDDGQAVRGVPVIADEDHVDGRIFDDGAAVEERVADGVAAAIDADAAAVFVADHVGRIVHVVRGIVAPEAPAPPARAPPRRRR